MIVSRKSPYVGGQNSIGQAAYKRRIVRHLRVSGQPARLFFEQPGHEQLSKASDGRRVEEIRQAELDVERLPQARRELGRQQRMAAQLEEIVMDADAVEAKHLLPDFANRPLQLVGGLGK